MYKGLDGVCSCIKLRVHKIFPHPSFKYTIIYVNDFSFAIFKGEREIIDTCLGIDFKCKTANEAAFLHII